MNRPPPARKMEAGTTTVGVWGTFSQAGFHDALYVRYKEQTGAWELGFLSEGGIAPPIDINDWLTAYAVPSASNGRDVPIPSNRVNNWSTYTYRTDALSHDCSHAFNHVSLHLKPFICLGGDVCCQGKRQASPAISSI